MESKPFEFSFDEDICKLWIDVEGRSRYVIGVDGLSSSAPVLDIIVQVAKKPWASDALVGALVRELNKLLVLQGNYCTVGKDCASKSSQEIIELISENQYIAMAWERARALTSKR